MCIIGHDNAALKEGWIFEEYASWSSDRSVLRACTHVTFNLRGIICGRRLLTKRLSRSKAANRYAGRIAAKTKYACRCGLGKFGIGAHGTSCRAQIMSDGRVRVIRGERTHDATREIKVWKSYRVGYYNGGNGLLSVNDGRQTARDITLILGATPHDRRRDYVLVS